MDSREAAERARLAETFLFRGAPPEAVELARTDPRTVRQENGKGGVIYAPVEAPASSSPCRVVRRSTARWSVSGTAPPVVPRPTAPSVWGR